MLYVLTVTESEEQQSKEQPRSREGVSSCPASSSRTEGLQEL